MDVAAFTKPAGVLVPTMRGRKAFVPAPLPPEIELGAVTLSLASAMQTIGELRGACRRFTNPQLLIRPLQRQEALTSSAMEGTFTTADNLLLAEVGVDQRQDDSTREVVNYIEALNRSLDLLKAYPISHRVLKTAHEILLSGLSPGRGAWKRPGDYKIEQNWIGGATIDQARFVPPPPVDAQACMDQLEAYINRSGSTGPAALLDLALVHYQIETIHPFADGNGRVGRMLISLMAVQTGLLDMPVLYISPVLERYKDRYIDLMFAVSARSAWTDWLNFFFERIGESCRDAVATIDRLIGLQAEYRDLVSGTSRSTTALSLIDLLFQTPAITVGDAKTHLGVSYPAAKTAIDKLVALGVLRLFQGASPKVFLAPAIVRASRPPEPDP